ncbi:hypothetical protein [Amycolatopsis sp. NPDC004079]|uniref:hypothetical protein n=1 Tax=Amycolatopsis sp. NPDC004079 TaxID=3154549 RepID=UPI0033A63236
MIAVGGSKFEIPGIGRSRRDHDRDLANRSATICRASALLLSADPGAGSVDGLSSLGPLGSSGAELAFEDLRERGEGLTQSPLMLPVKRCLPSRVSIEQIHAPLTAPAVP